MRKASSSAGSSSIAMPPPGPSSRTAGAPCADAGAAELLPLPGAAGTPGTPGAPPCPAASASGSEPSLAAAERASAGVRVRELAAPPVAPGAAPVAACPAARTRRTKLSSSSWMPGLLLSNCGRGGGGGRGGPGAIDCRRYSRRYGSLTGRDSTGKVPLVTPTLLFPPISSTTRTAASHQRPAIQVWEAGRSAPGWGRHQRLPAAQAGTRGCR